VVPDPGRAVVGASPRGPAGALQSADIEDDLATIGRWQAQWQKTQVTTPSDASAPASGQRAWHAHLAGTDAQLQAEQVDMLVRGACRSLSRGAWPLYVTRTSLNVDGAGQAAGTVGCRPRAVGADPTLLLHGWFFFFGGDISRLAALPDLAAALAPTLPMRWILAGDSDGQRPGVGAALREYRWLLGDPAIDVSTTPETELAKAGITAVIPTVPVSINHRRMFPGSNVRRRGDVSGTQASRTPDNIRACRPRPALRIACSPRAACRVPPCQTPRFRHTPPRFQMR